ncbi:MAG: hypothetical protein MH204_07970 [Fimbriimonadaceae bacterium]|nr:hypothetical protein [Fimbriimonadaceae bacterium]
MQKRPATRKSGSNLWKTAGLILAFVLTCTGIGALMYMVVAPSVMSLGPAPGTRPAGQTESPDAPPPTSEGVAAGDSASPADPSEQAETPSKSKLTVLDEDMRSGRFRRATVETISPGRDAGETPSLTPDPQEEPSETPEETPIIDPEIPQEE